MPVFWSTISCQDCYASTRDVNVIGQCPDYPNPRTHGCATPYPISQRDCVRSPASKEAGVSAVSNGEKTHVCVVSRAQVQAGMCGANFPGFQNGSSTTPGLNGTATNSSNTHADQACSSWGSMNPDGKVSKENSPVDGITTSYSVLELFDPPTEVKKDIRRFELPESQPIGAPGYCKDGGCWSCLTSFRSGVSTGSTIETCNHGLGILNAEREHGPSARPSDGAQRLGNWNSWKFYRGRLGPGGVQLYDIYSIAANDFAWSEDFVPIYKDIAIAKVSLNEENTNAGYERHEDMRSQLGDPVIFFEACTGRTMKAEHGINEKSCTFVDDASIAGWWYIRDPALDDHVFSNDDPLDI